MALVDQMNATTPPLSSAPTALKGGAPKERPVPVSPARALLRDPVALLPGGTVRLINPLIYANAGAIGDAAFRRHLFRINAAGDLPQPPALLGRYPPGTLIDGGGPFHVLAGGIMVAEQLAPNFPDLAGNFQHLLGRRADAVRIAGPCVLACHAGIWVWGHWLVDTLPRILLTERAYPGRFSFAVPHAITDPSSDRFFVRCVLDSLAAYAIGEDRLLRLRAGTVYSFDALFDVADLRYQRRLHGGALAALRALPNPPPGRGRYRITAAMRGPADTRQLTDRPAIDAALRRHGATEFDVHAAPFLEQVRAFRDSALLVGDMGSNLAHAVYADPGAPVVTLAPSGWPDGYFADLFRRARIRHADVRGVSQPSPGQAIEHAPHHVEPAHLDAAIEAARGAASGGADAPVIVDGREMPRVVGAVLRRLDFGELGNARAHQRGGFCAPEGARTWSDGPTSRLVLDHFDAPGGDLWLEIVGIAHVHPPVLPFRMLGVSINGVRLATLDVAGDSHLHVRVPGAVLAGGSPLGISFHHGHCPSPHALGAAPDRRALGFMFETISLRHMQ